MDSERLKHFAPNVLTQEVPNGVALTDLTNSASIQKNRSILFVGTLNWDPNSKAVIFLTEQIWPLLKKKYPDVTCDIVGAHPPRELVDLSKADKAFRVHGFVSELDDYLNPGAVFVCPIKDGGGTKLKILDALAMRAAVVADPVACEGIDVQDGKDVLFASSAEEYVLMISKIFESEQLRETLGINARSLIEGKYSYHSIGLKLSALYNTIVQGVGALV